jgi:hypothetical protein
MNRQDHNRISLCFPGYDRSENENLQNGNLQNENLQNENLQNERLAK